MPRAGAQETVLTEAGWGDDPRAKVVSLTDREPRSQPSESRMSSWCRTPVAEDAPELAAGGAALTVPGFASQASPG